MKDQTLTPQAVLELLQRRRDAMKTLLTKARAKALDWIELDAIAFAAKSFHEAALILEDDIDPSWGCEHCSHGKRCHEIDGKGPASGPCIMYQCGCEKWAPEGFRDYVRDSGEPL